MGEEVDHRYLTWSDIEWRCKGIANSVKSKGLPITRILGVSRGGLIPAVLIARALGIRRVSSIQTELYEDKSTSPPIAPIVYDWEGELAWARTHQTEVLVVDEIISTGKTLSALASRIPNAAYAALFISDQPRMGTPLPKNLILGEPVARNVWINFPWEY